MTEFTNRCLRERLTPNEFCVFTFVLDRTVGFLKEWEVIRMKQFLYGSLPDEDGVQHFCGLKMSERTIQRTLVTLQNYELIHWRDKSDNSGLREYRVAGLDDILEIPVSEGQEINFWMYDPENGQKMLAISENILKSDS